jgi:hypothetical protein
MRVYSMMERREGRGILGSMRMSVVELYTK